MLLWQCDGFLTALQRGRAESLAARRRYDVRGSAVFIDHQQAFSEFQSALTFAANVSKMLWPRVYPSESAAAEKRAKRLRYILGIKRRFHVLYSVPTMRNNFEHLDVRLDKWAKRTVEGAIAIHTLAGDKVLKVAAGDMFTRYDPTRDAVSMLDKRIDLKTLEASVIKIRNASALAFRDIRRFLERLESLPESK
jgi:hypothetical protein